MSLGVSELRIGDGLPDRGAKDARSGVPVPSAAAKDSAAAAPAKKGGLGRQFGRLGGAVSGKNRRNP